MSQSALSRELALAIGLAAKALPDTQPKQLVQTLMTVLGYPLTLQKIQTLSIAQYAEAISKTSGSQILSPDCRESLDILQRSFANQSLTREQPEPIIVNEQSEKNAIRVAVASQQGSLIDDHFSTCRYFYIYQVSPHIIQLSAKRKAETRQMMKAEQKQVFRADLINDCQVLYSLSIGGQAAAKVIKQGVHPIKFSQATRTDLILEQLQYVLQTSPPPWLAKAMGFGSSFSNNRNLQESAR